MSCYCFLAYSQNRVLLHSDWKFRKAGAKEWLPATVPGCVHTDLLDNQLILDPFYASNEQYAQWVEKETWEYTRNIYLEKEPEVDSAYWLCFDGLDTYASVTLNGQVILKANNMFRAWEVNVSGIIKQGNNDVIVTFLPAVLLTCSLPGGNRVLHRKAQYQFGWDWGPRLVTCGIWRDVCLKKTNLLYPHVFIKDHIYRPKVELVQVPDKTGKTFYFQVNGKPVFMKGANWIPLDHFTTRVTDTQYRKSLTDAKNAGVNMMRVWGGGIYENDIFYKLCDSLGIFVWQDFMFACGMYPGDSLFLDNVKKEAEYQVQRLNKFNCVILWCGNNEISEGWNNWGWQKEFNYSAGDSSKIWKDYVKLFEEILPGVVTKFSDRPYISTSPKHGWGRKQSLTEGDCHYWGVWWGMEPFETYEKKVPRFMSEYGFQGMPDLRSLGEFIRPGHLHLDSADLKSHQKHPTGFETINKYMEMYYRRPKDINSYVYLTQLLQADAIRHAVTAHRLNQPYCMGTLVWQWNDTWPVTSWSVIDHYGRKKAAYYELKRLYKEPFLPVYKPTGFPKTWELQAPGIEYKLKTVQGFTVLELTCKNTAISVFLDAGNGIEFEDNYFDMVPGAIYTVIMNSDRPLTFQELQSKLKILSLYDTYEK